jgi:uncharacterized SAM-binding protein YcdF (DUF218 family)
LRVTASLGKDAGSLPGGRSSLRFIVPVILIAAVACATLAFRGVGKWLIREDPLQQADVLVVLSGGMPYRAEEAARLFHVGYAREIWVSRPPSVASELAKSGISYFGEEFYNREVLIRAGVPPNSIFIFPEPAIDTEQEIREITRELREKGSTSALIVTSPQHTRRVKTLWRKIAGSGQALIVQGAPQDPFDADHWWRDTGDVFSVVRELLGLLNAWFGLPVRPQT